MEKSRIPFAVVLVVMFVALGLAGYGVATLAEELLFAFRATKAEGVVQSSGGGAKSKDSTDGKIPVRVFQNGRSVEYQISGSWTKPKGGERVAILVIPERPESARVDRFLERYFVPLVVLVPGVVLLGFVVWELRRRRRYWQDVQDRDRLTPALWKHH